LIARTIVQEEDGKQGKSRKDCNQAMMLS
jgi:hypothetical protein